MTNANIPTKKKKTIYKKKFLKKYKYKLWYKNYKFLSFLISFLKWANLATDLKSSGKAFHALAAMYEVHLRKFLHCDWFRGGKPVVNRP